MKSKGPKIDPCGTPHKISEQQTEGIINFCSLLSIREKTLYDSERLVAKTVGNKLGYQKVGQTARTLERPGNTVLLTPLCSNIFTIFLSQQEGSIVY